VTRAANLGFPRIGAKRELKRATEAYWKGAIDASDLHAKGAELRARHWMLQNKLGVEVIPCNDFSFYDQVLDMTVMLGAVPERFEHPGGDVDIHVYFAMARGSGSVRAMEMTKWFDTNYHYIVPEFRDRQRFALSSRKPVSEFEEAKALGIETRPVLIGPVTFLTLGKASDSGREPLSLLESVLPVYREILSELRLAGADWVQLDEPVLGLDISPAQRAAFQTAYAELGSIGIKILVASYFEGLRDNLELAMSLPVHGLHVDLVSAPEQLDPVLDELPNDRVLSIGVVNGRNIWRTKLSATFETVSHAHERIGGERLEIAPSCSLLHTPVDLDNERRLDPLLKSWLAFSKQKLAEVVALATAARDGRRAVLDAFRRSDESAQSRAQSERTFNPDVRRRIASIGSADLQRESEFANRRERQRAACALPIFPTTTIGSFPQTPEVRRARAAFRRGDTDEEQYEVFLRGAVAETVRMQEEIGLDVLVHGEFERNDMVEYFGEHLEGFAITQHGWVQSFGSRYVKPPVIFGDVSRPAPMTIKWSVYAQSLTDRPMKGMLTGPVTILQWSFVRDDQPRSQTCRQIALAMRDEVCDLERAGICIIQIDEPALREGLPLRHADRDAYLQWAVESFRLTVCGVRDETQIHTHMCYSNFNDIMASIASLDADVISIEASRSDMELLDAFVDFEYPNEIGPGIWDIHSPRVPSPEEIRKLLSKAVEVIPCEKIWVNPDCGLKTRAWPEVLESLQHMVQAARELRNERMDPSAHGRAG